jgi:four helix bundle protein
VRGERGQVRGEDGPDGRDLTFRASDGCEGGRVAFLFEKLEVYQKALSLAERVSSLTEHFPRNQWYLSDQFNRAALSISLNVAEGNGRWTDADRRNFFGLARGSVHECVPLVELCRRKGLIADTICSELKGELEVIAKMLSGLVARTRGK